MRVKATSEPLAGWSGQAEITTDHPASREGIPVLLVGGEPVGIVDAAAAGYELLEATADERRALRDAGYCLPENTLTPS